MDSSDRIWEVLCVALIVFMLYIAFAIFSMPSIPYQ